ncbi:MAG TPA: hypothetical protein VEK11_03490 [Thermoanaerobaculia bacterium]|nr:hypothetical protein [Thermoanaerobaculia bacterium]
MAFRTSAGIRIELEAVDGRNLVYLATVNDATLKLTNLTGAAIAIAASSFSIELSLSALYLDPADQALVSISASGWNPQFVSGQFPAWQLRPASDMQWNDGAVLPFALSNLTPTVDAGSYNIGVTIRGYTSHPYYVSLPVDVADADSGPADLAGTFAVDVTPAVVNVTKSSQQFIANAFEVTFMNTDANAALVTEPWTTPPEFTVSFIYSDEPRSFALTSESHAAVFEVGIANGAGWQAPRRTDTPTGPKWIMQPDPGNQEVLGVREQAFITFSFGNVVTEAAAGPTQMYVEWNNVPGYRDDNLSVVLQKEYLPVSMSDLQINQPLFTPGAQAYLSWTVDNAMLVELSGVGEVPRQAFDYAVTVDQTTTFVLTAIDPLTGVVDTRSVTATVEPSPLQDTIPPGTIVMWYGLAEDWPSGLLPCDGNDGRPDLRDRFVLAAGVEAVRTMGEATHDHPITAWTSASLDTSAVPDHDHLLPSEWSKEDFDEASGLEIRRTGIDTLGDHVDVATQAAGGHGHTVTVTIPAQRTGTNTQLRPRWFALLYGIQQ